MLSQSLPSCLQNAVSVSATHPHTPLPPHGSGAVHVPQEPTVRLVPQLSLSETLPQFRPNREQKAVSVSGVQQTLLLSHVCGDEHVQHELIVRMHSEYK
jgi:hypothetical protein